GEITVLMITHKFREVMAFADTVSVLRRGRLAGEGRVAGLNPAALAEMMVGSREIPQSHKKDAGSFNGAEPRLVVRDLVVLDDAGLPAVERLAPAVLPCEVL